MREGDEITPYYDPMIAKLIVHGATRSEAVERLRAALARFHVSGVRTNVEFLFRLTSAPSFAKAHLDTALIERERAHLFPVPAVPPELAWQLAARATLAEPPRDGSPWSDGCGWRLAGSRAARTVKLRSGEDERDVVVEFGANAPRGDAYRGSDGVHVWLEGIHHVFAFVDPYLPPTGAVDTHGGLTAPMPGRVLAVLVKESDVVAKGAPLVIVEAMKMEHTVTAPSAGRVEKVFVAVDQQVKEGFELLRLAVA